MPVRLTQLITTFLMCSAPVTVFAQSPGPPGTGSRQAVQPPERSAGQPTQTTGQAGGQSGFSSQGLDNPTAQLAEANEAYQARDYAKAIPLLTYLLYPDIRFTRKWQTVDARLLLGAAHFETGNLVYARREFDEALRLDDEVPMDPIAFSPEAIAFFEKRRTKFREQLRRTQIKLDEARANDRLREALDKLVVIERRPYYINFVPFGAGQFQNGHNRKGLLFFASEAATCTASAVLWTVQVSRYGVSGRVVPADEVPTVLRLQQFQIGAGAACLVLMGTGIVDALLNYRSETRVPADESLLPEEFRKRLGKKKPRASVHLLPTAGPEGAGVAMSWEF